MGANIEPNVSPARTKLSELGFSLADSARLMRAAFGARMRELGLQGSNWRLLAHLHRQDGLSQAELARRLEVTRAGVGLMARQLEASGHIERRLDPGDGRSWRLFLTARTRTQHAPLLRIMREFEEDLAAAFSDAEIEFLNELVERLRDQIALVRAQSGRKENL